MSEMKRVELTSVASSQKQKKVNFKQSTHRFVLVLGESNSQICPEYSFADLVKNEKPINGGPFDEIDEDKDVAAIAQRFEAKYGPKTLFSGKRKRTQEMDDFYDPGEGYDEDDPFIDNTEAHDEVVPSTLTTQHGGFYINQGKLDFKCLDENSSDEFTHSPVVKKKKKRVLNSDSEEETGAALAKKFKAMKRKRQLESQGGERQKKKKRGEDGELIFRRKKIKTLEKLNTQNSVPEALSEREAVMPSAAVTTLPLASSPVTTSTPNKTTTTTVVNGSVDDICGTLGKGDREAAEEIPSAILQDCLRDDSSSKSGDDGKGDNQPTDKNMLLPSQLPPELQEAIENIKREAKESKEKKLRFFSDNVNKLLLDIELRSRSLAWGSRTAIYSHLGEHLPCGKHTLQRRAKKLREAQEEGQFKVPMQKLREAIMKIMPSLQEQHEIDVQRAKMESGLKEEVTDGKEEASTESEEEEKSDNRKKPRSPRRKFQWTSEIRELLLDIVSTKVKLYNQCKSRNQTAEEYLKAFLDSEIKPLWPQGWMQTRMLFKESKKAHEDLTKSVLQQGKQRKASVADMASSNIEGIISHMSKTEDVIEISSIVESDDEKNGIIIINVSNSDESCLEQIAPVSSPAPLPSPVPSSSGQISKQSFKTTTASVLATHQSAAVSSTSSPKVAEISSSTSIKRIVPVPVSESCQISSPKSAVITKSFAPGFPPNAASTPGGPGSNTQQQKTQSSNQQSPNQQKSTLQHKSVPPQPMVNITQQKLPQELQKVPSMQQNKAAMRNSSPVVVMDTPNLSWTNVNSVEPSRKLFNPVVAVNRIPETSAQKLSAGSKSSNTLQQNQMLMQRSQQREKILNSSVFKPNHINRRQQPESGVGSPSYVGTTSDTQNVGKVGTVSQNVMMSSKENPQTKPFIQHEGQMKASSHPNPHLKSGIVIGTSSNSVQKFGQQHNHFKAGTVIDTCASSQLSVRTAADFPSWTQQSSPGGMKQSSPPRKVVPSSVTTSSAASPSIISSGLLNISSSSLSRSSTPSPQKSPVSPEGNAALSLYEQIQSQIRHQEAMEDQALKNLALALKFGSSGVPSRFGDASSQPGGR